MTRLYFAEEQPLAVVTGRGVGASGAREQALLAFARIRRELEALDSSLEDVVRVAVFTRNQECRPAVTEVRRELFPQATRPASSSLIVHDLLDTLVEVEATAILAPGRAIDKRGVEFEPPRPYLKALAAADFLFLSGTGGEGEGLESQTRAALDTIDSTLRGLGSSWERLFDLAFYVKRGEGVEVAHNIARQRAAGRVGMDFTLCDDFARPEMLVEVEGSAWR